MKSDRLTGKSQGYEPPIPPHPGSEYGSHVERKQPFGYTILPSRPLWLSKIWSVLSELAFFLGKTSILTEKSGGVSSVRRGGSGGGDDDDDDVSAILALMNSWRTANRLAAMSVRLHSAIV